jgi:pyrimidine-nucleoside phosphorylase
MTTSVTSDRFSAVDIIARKQKGETLSHAEIEWFIRASTAGEIPDYQTSAFLMAVYFRGMTLEETRHLTAAMMATGKTLRLRSVRGKKVDKHSTGGVGDKISLIVGPLVASVGVRVPMISGRALGHTGGTLDKLESIPGFRTDLTPRSFERVVRKVGISIIGQTTEVAPADRKLYALRDVTSTVRCQPLIVSSILSKKIASGTDAVVFDIKCGEGAFMKNVREAKNLAALLSKVAAMLGMTTSTVITRMDEPLGSCVGNAIEVREAIEVLRGKWVEDLVDVSLTLGSEMLMLAGKAKRREEALRLLRTALLGGKALQTFREMVRAHGGDARIADEPGRLVIDSRTTGVKAARSGYVSDIDALEVGRIATILGAGRLRAEDEIDHSVGIEFLKKKGGRVKKGETLALIYSDDVSRARHSARLLKRAVAISASRPRVRRTVIGRVTSRGVQRLPAV